MNTASPFLHKTAPFGEPETNFLEALQPTKKCGLLLPGDRYQLLADKKLITRDSTISVLKNAQDLSIIHYLYDLSVVFSRHLNCMIQDFDGLNLSSLGI